MGHRNNRSIGGQLYLVGAFIICGSGFLSTLITNASPLPDVFSDLSDVVNGKRDVIVSGDRIRLGPTNQDIVMYSVVCIGAILLVIGFCVCCCRRRQVYVHTSVVHANPNSSVGYHK